jgi:hypothetical protein
MVLLMMLFGMKTIVCAHGLKGAQSSSSSLELVSANHFALEQPHRLLFVQSIIDKIVSLFRFAKGFVSLWTIIIFCVLAGGCDFGGDYPDMDAEEKNP